MTNYPMAYIIKTELPYRVKERSDILYPNLNAEMARQKLSIKMVADDTGISYDTLKLKFRGSSEFKLNEMKKIRRLKFPECTLDYLFATEEDEKK